MTKLILCFALVLALPWSVFAQFVDRGDYVQVAKGTHLCSNFIMDQAKGSLDPGRVFWKVTSATRSNGTQTVSAFINETVYDRLSGDTKVTQRSYDQDYAIFFKRDPTHQGMLLLISPQDGQIEATTEVCQKKK